ncbi:branched-chain amino acid ABC transporter permease [Sinorhizobium fredii]|uniref:High-affinity branched-chain amino acid ABC transporter permease protein n=1 Tax=Rhizobium fredii TaxID=380 RepID=A0A2L0HBM2_RHIFR|nr:branched-chain amino acid ABC transporter permease [Sinorhizobium fredii]AUX78797.1 high-affinity branched-chain amino acid ABC transporter permease protein [Sinorhizobium fredii]
MQRQLYTAGLLALIIVAIATATTILGMTLYERIVTNMMIMMVLVVSLQSFMGNSGILSFAHVGFMAIGAYVSAIFTIPGQMKGMALPDLYPFMKDMHLPIYAAILVGGIVAAIVAAVVSFPLMRLSDSAAVITSFGLLVVIYTVTNNWSAVTNGPRTLFGLPKATDLGMTSLAAIGAVIVAVWFKESRTGKLLRASRDDERAAAAIGANIPVLRWRAFVLAALLAGIGGGLWGHFITSFAPKAFYLKETFLIISMLVIGGTNTVTGAVVGTLLVTFVYEGLRAFEGQLNAINIAGGQVVGLTEIVLSLGMIAILVLRPGGLVEYREIGSLFHRGKTRSVARPHYRRTGRDM